jgi:ABC-type sugar transport system substrate-binding protein
MKKTVTMVVLLTFALMTMVLAPMAWAKPFPRSWLWASTEQKMMDTSKFKKNPPYTIGFSNASISNSWRVFFERQVRYGADLHQDVIKKFYVTDANDKPDKQIADVEDLIAKGCDLLIISAATMAALDPIVTRTMRRGIPVVCVDRRVSSDNFVSFVTSSNVAQGRAQMLWLCEMLRGKGKSSCSVVSPDRAPQRREDTAGRKCSARSRGSRFWISSTRTGLPRKARGSCRPSFRPTGGGSRACGVTASRRAEPWKP